MHISEGVLSGSVLAAGGILTVAGTAVGLKKLDYDRIAAAGIFSAAFFTASLIHVNIGPASVHLLLNGLMGLVLGWVAFPAILTGLLMQAFFFQFGGLTTLGVNTLNLALPAVTCACIFRPMLGKKTWISLSAAFLCGFLSVFLASLMLAVSLIFTEENFLTVAVMAVTANLPVMIIEGVITVFCIVFLKKMKLVGILDFSNSHTAPDSDGDGAAGK